MDQNISGEIKLLQASIKGSNEAFEKLVCKYQSLVCAITYSATGDIEKSEELAQETFVRAWKNLAQLKDQSRFKNWLCSIAKSAIKNYFRNRKRDIIHKAGVITHVEEISIPAADPAHNLIAKEQQVVVDQALQVIPESYRQPLVLFYRQERSISQVAEQLELSEDNVRTRLSRGRKMLKEQVVKMVENSLSNTAPGKAFTVAVMASVAGLALKGTTAAAATVTTNGVSAASSAGGSITTIISGVTAKIIIAAAVAVIAVGGAITYKALNNNETVVGAVSSTKVLQEEVEVTEQQIAAKSLVGKDDSKVADAGGKLQQGQVSSISKTAINTTHGAGFSDADVVEDFNGSIITVKVIEKETGVPIPNARISTYPSIEENPMADEQGIYVVKIPKGGTTSINLFAQPRGYVWQSFSCGEGRFIDYFPKEVVFALDYGTVVGGIVQDPNGNPIAGAEVSFGYTKGMNDDKPGIDLRFRQKTKADGRWECISAPNDLSMCSASARHRQYASASAVKNEKEFSTQLRDQTYVLRLNQGFSISGTVADELGNPINGARIQLGEWYGQSGDAWRNYTDRNGYYEFTNRNNGRTYATVTASGFAPELKIVRIQDESTVVDFVLTEGSPVYGRVLDTAGNGVAGARVGADDWCYTVPNSIRSLDWNMQTDNEGRFVWAHAPEEIVQFAISKKGFMTFETPDVTPSDTEYEFVVYDKLRVSGQVIDAVSKEPITEFIFKRYEGGYVSQPNRIVDAAGKFSTAIERQGEKYTIVFDAEGYAPTKSRVISLGEQDVNLVVEMAADSGIDGVLVDANGMPLGGVGVIIPNNSLYLDDMKYIKSTLHSHNFTKTDANGFFHFDPVVNDNYIIVVIEDEGYVYMEKEDFPEDGIFVLQPYGRIVGDYYKGGEPVVNERIRVDYPDYHMIQTGNKFEMGNLSINYGVQTDGEGKFVFDKLIHGKVRILVDPYKYVEIKAGETKEVYLGGDGLTVSGQVLDPNGKPLNEEFGKCELVFQRIYDKSPIPEDQWPLPDNADAMRYDEFTDWFTEFGKSDEGRHWLAAMEEQYDNLTGRYSCKVDKNGYFERANVKSGMYLLKVSVRPWQDEYSRPIDFPKRIDYNGGYIAKASAVVVVPEFETYEEMTVPIDIGVLQCRRCPLKVGMQAPDFEIDKLKSDGNIRLSDYRGKKILVNFTNPVLQEIAPEKSAALAKVCEMAKSRNDVAIINVALEEMPWDYMREKMKHQCRLPGVYGVGHYYNSKIAFDYDIGSLPESVLISSKGKILFKGQPGQELLDIIFQP